MINSKKRLYKRKRDFEVLPEVKSCCINVNFTSKGDWDLDLNNSYMDITSFIKQGTGRHQRIGDKIKLLKAHVRIYYNFRQRGYSGIMKYCAIRHGLVKTKFRQDITNHSEFLRVPDFGPSYLMTNIYDDIKVEVLKDSLSTLYQDIAVTPHAYKVYDYVKDINEIIGYFDNDKPDKQLVLSDFFEYDRNYEQNPSSPWLHRHGNITLYFIDV